LQGCIHYENMGPLCHKVSINRYLVANRFLILLGACATCF
jgi:hypothetical protein